MKEKNNEIRLKIQRLYNRKIIHEQRKRNDFSFEANKTNSKTKCIEQWPDIIKQAVTTSKQEVTTIVILLKI